MLKQLFENLKNNKVNFLKVGNDNDEWKSYFQNADLNTTNINKLDLDIITNFKNEFPMAYKFDIIIDDGLHSIDADLNLFNYLNDMVRVGGFYIIKNNNVKLLIKLNLTNYQVIHNTEMIILKKKEDKVSFENELTIEYLSKIKENDFTKFFEYDKYKINHNKQKVFSMSLFNQKVDLDYPEDQDNEYWKNKYYNSILKLVPLINKTEYGINLFCEERYKDLIDNPNVNVFTFKHSVGAVGMYWRFLSINMVDETIICDIDIDNIEIHKVMMKYNLNCRYVASGKNNFYVDKEETAKKYSSILCSQIKFLKKDFDFNLKDIMIKFCNHQKYYQDNERKNIYNKSVGHMVNGFGNNTLNYGCDERFMAKVIYFYLVKKSKLLTIYENHNNYENKEDIDYTMRHGNKLIFTN